MALDPGWDGLGGLLHALHQGGDALQPPGSVAQDLLPGWAGQVILETCKENKKQGIEMVTGIKQKMLDFWTAGRRAFSICKQPSCGEY